ncbi:alpha/beta hydrolase family protein [Oceanospirillum sediminis]|uniref:Dienelactone hydrolase n=1 Tax=Oceanospirillum sediminis TaxID=2760088 RepID=A0A839IPG0_9GAMM|nr:hypothetical protein [Oceanospirillum sediminis]MBB1486136.1 hypothetical protein [Oceanospirillum sediminis]
MKKIQSIVLTMLLAFGFEAVADINAALKIESIYSEDRGKNIEVYYWYPTKEQKLNFRFGNKKIFLPVDVALDADIALGKFPIIVLSHGGMRSSFSHVGWIASSLSKEGYIVITPKPPEYDELVPDQAIDELYLRPGDISTGLSGIDNISLFDGNIDKENTTGVGFFLGGTSMLTLAGAKFDLKKYKASCNDAGVNIDCKWFSNNKVDISSVSGDLVTKLKKDDRIRSIVIINPELTKTLDANSLRDVKGKVSVISLSGELDSALAPSDNLSKIPLFNISEISSAVAFSAFSICTPKGIKILSIEGEAGICSELNQYTREENHKKIIASIVQSLPGR